MIDYAAGLLFAATGAAAGSGIVAVALRPRRVTLRRAVAVTSISCLLLGAVLGMPALSAGAPQLMVLGFAAALSSLTWAILPSRRHVCVPAWRAVGRVMRDVTALVLFGAVFALAGFLLAGGLLAATAQS